MLQRTSCSLILCKTLQITFSCFTDWPLKNSLLSLTKCLSKHFKYYNFLKFTDSLNWTAVRFIKNVIYETLEKWS